MDNILFRLCVRLNLSPKDNGYIAILIHVMKTEHDNALDWPFSGRLSIIIVHPTYVYFPVIQFKIFYFMW